MVLDSEGGGLAGKREGDLNKYAAAGRGKEDEEGSEEIIVVDGDSRGVLSAIGVNNCDNDGDEDGGPR